ncbi:MAG: hypothetical protein WEB13_11300 [Dehalococcoidia bacterium]
MKTTIKFVSISVASAIASLAIFTGAALAAYALLGDAIIVSGGNPGNAAQLRSDATLPPSFGVARFDVNTPWSSLSTLSTDFNVTDDNCGGGSPRIQLAVDTDGDGLSDGNVHIAFGPSPTFTGCAPGWQSTGNLIGNEDAGRYDYSQFGGSPFTTYSAAPALVLSGTVLRASVVVDGSWSAAATGGDGEQTVLIDNVNINGAVETFDLPADKDACKNDGWQSLFRADGSPFKNQGDCIQFVNTGM